MAVKIEIRPGEASLACPPPTRGIGLAIVNREGQVWVHRDSTSRTQTGRRAGDLSIPFETQKREESLEHNVLGAVPEVVDNNTLSLLAQHLYTTDNFRSTRELYYRNGGKPIHYRVAVTVFGGDPGIYFTKPHDNEANPYGWMYPEELLGREDLRPLARHAVSYLHNNGIIDVKLAEYLHPHPPFRRGSSQW